MSLLSTIYGSWLGHSVAFSRISFLCLLLCHFDAVGASPSLPPELPAPLAPAASPPHSRSVYAAANDEVHHFCSEGYPPRQCSSIWDVCGTPGNGVRHQRKIGDKSQVCIAFESTSESGGSAQKALFHLEVDTYSRLRVSSLLPAFASGNWSDVEPYSYMWIASEGHRAVGQTTGIVTGLLDNGGVNCTAAREDAVFVDESGCSSAALGCRCFGWINQSKPVITRSAKLIAALTAIIHMENGIVTHIAWDSQCNLCQGRIGEAGSSTLEAPGTLTCNEDNSGALCTKQDGWGSDGQTSLCSDCYVQIEPSDCIDDSCVPTVYIAWEGTDAHGQPLLSSGAILSRFQQYSLQGVYDEIRDEILEVPNHPRG